MHQVYVHQKFGPNQITEGGKGQQAKQKGLTRLSKGWFRTQGMIITRSREIKLIKIGIGAAGKAEK